jgi:hypothetical protein
MIFREWMEMLSDGRVVKFTWQEGQEGGAVITAQVAGSETVHSILLPDAIIPLSLEEVVNHFTAALAKK